MWKLIKRRWHYLTARLQGRFDEIADPKIQLEQAINEAREQHRRLKDQAANVIANQKQAEMRLNRALSELERVNRSTRGALMMAAQANTAGDDAKALSCYTAAERLAGRLIALDRETESLKGLLFLALEAADHAKAAVAQNALSLQDKLSQRQKLLGQLDQARMQEQMNEAMATLEEAVGEDVPSFSEVRDNIEARFAKAQGVAELTEGAADAGAEMTMLEIEAATRDTEAKARLALLSDQLGIGPVRTPEITQTSADNSETGNAAASDG